MSDTNSHIYRYSWDKEDLLNYQWPEHYVKQPEILRYLNHVVDKYDLRQHFLFNTEMVSADFDESQNVWKLQTKKGETIIARFVVTALGLLSKVLAVAPSKLRPCHADIRHSATSPNIQVLSSSAGRCIIPVPFRRTVSIGQAMVAPKHLSAGYNSDY